MALQYLFDPNKQFQSIGGVNEVSGFLRVFLNGTDDRATTYKNFDGTLNEADIVLDSYGRAVVIVDDTKTYRIEVYNRLGGLMWTVSNYKASGGSGGGTGTPVSVEGTVGEIDVDENTEGGVKHFVIGLASTIKNAIATLTMAVNGVANALNGKKDKQAPVNESGATTKTLVGISQDSDGVMTAEFDDIEFPDYSQRFENIENEQAVDAKVIAAALNDLNARLAAIESEGDNIGDVKADSLDAQNLYVGGVKVKFQQAAKSIDGATDKTVTNLSQDENGVITVTYSAIAFPDWTGAITAATDLCEKLANKKTTFSGFETSETYYPTLNAVVKYLDGRLQNLGGKKITNNGQPFTAASQLPTTTPYYGQNINSDDYAYVQDTGLASRYTATVTGSSVAWSLDYEIAIPAFTAEQQAAIDSGANSTKIGNYDSHLANTNNPHGVTYSQVGASPDTHTHQVVINGVTKTIDKTGGTPVDLGTYLTSHQDLSGYLSKTGDGSDVTASFATAGSRNNISTGEKLSVIFGKIAKWFGDLKAVAFSGSYNDLSNKPTIPIVNNGKLTISRNGTALGSFTANQSSLLGIDISVPTKTSDLVNDSLLINDGTLTIKQNGVSKGTFSANQLGNVTINLDDTTTVSSVEKTALGQVNTLPVASMVSSAFKAGTFLLKATADGGEPYVFNDVTIPNNKWYKFTVNGESSNYCVITLEIVAGSASSAFGTFKLLVDSGSVKKVVRVPYATKTAAVGSVTTPVYVDDNGEFKESTSVAQKASSGSGNLAVIDVNGDYSSSGISAYDQTMLNGLTSRLGSFVSAINSFSHSFNVIFNGSDISKTLDFENTYAIIKFLRFGISYVSGKISYRLPWSGASVDYNGWIIAPDTQTKNGKSIVHTTHTFTVAGNTNTEELYEENELGTTGQSVASIFEKQITTSQTVRGRLSSEIRLYNGVSYKELIVHVDIGYERLSSTGAFYAFGTVTCNTDLFEND